MQDQQLAVAIARVYEGDNGPVLRQFLEDKVLPLAAEEGNRWQATWAFWMLQQRDRAVRALVVSGLAIHARSAAVLSFTDIHALSLLFARFYHRPALQPAISKLNHS